MRGMRGQKFRVAQNRPRSTTSARAPPKKKEPKWSGEAAAGSSRRWRHTTETHGPHKQPTSAATFERHADYHHHNPPPMPQHTVTTPHLCGNWRPAGYRSSPGAFSCLYTERLGSSGKLVMVDHGYLVSFRGSNLWTERGWVPRPP